MFRFHPFQYSARLCRFFWCISSDPFHNDECTIVLAFRVLFQADWPCALLMFRISFYYYSCTYVSCYHHCQIEQRVPPSTILQCIDLRFCCAPYHPRSCSRFSYIAPIAVAFFGTSSHYLYGPFTYLNNISDHLHRLLGWRP